MEAHSEGVTIIREFDAPREHVWKALTDPELLKRWWGPKDFTSPEYKIDLRVGGRYLNAMRSPDGQVVWGTGVFRQVVPYERLVMTDSFSDEQGNIVPPSQYGMEPLFPSEMLISITLQERSGVTRLELKHSGTTGLSDEDRRNMEIGWNESLDKFQQVVESVKAGVRG